eukprot:TRINITY_DN2939_c0_g1_i1.p1 TRINITY_DN2939_c0_g1~~TRINITY_DN2939_c0_g1_i1.p1  ORF type:complete len:327 (-),score=69.91 TRINITY_DN2939_c0_g1_i1:73-1053(-)
MRLHSIVQSSTGLINNLHSLNSIQFALFKCSVFCYPHLLNSHSSSFRTTLPSLQTAHYSTSNNKSTPTSNDNTTPLSSPSQPQPPTHRKLSEMVIQYMKDPNIKPKVSEEKEAKEDEEQDLNKLTWRERKVFSKQTTQWDPVKKLPRAEMEKLRFLYQQDPNLYTKSYLAGKFRISFEAVRRILASNWRPTEREQEKQERNKMLSKAEGIEKRESDKNQDKAHNKNQNYYNSTQPRETVRKVKKRAEDRVLSQYKEKYTPKIHSYNNINNFNNRENNNNSATQSAPKSAENKTASSKAKTTSSSGLFAKQSKSPKKPSPQPKTSKG